MTNRSRRLAVIALLGLVALAAVSIGVYRNHASRVHELARHIRFDVLHITSDRAKEDWIVRTEDATRLINYADGYELDFPAGTELDLSRSSVRVVGTGDGFRATVTMEYSPYVDPNQEMTDGLSFFAPDFPWEDGVDQYIGYYQSRFLLNRDWQENNRVDVTAPEVFDAAGHKGYAYHAVIRDVVSGEYDAYSYFFVRCAHQDFLRVVFSYDSGNTALRDSLPSLFGSFRTFSPSEPGRMETDFRPELPEEWSDETRALYERIQNSGELLWGIYTGDIFNTGLHEKVPELEEKLDFRFPIILAYIHSTMDFPTDFMEENRTSGRVVELTYQLTENNNTDMRGYSPLLDLYRGVNEDSVRAFARAAKEFGHPFLFRLCNEMNSDWTSYGGVNNMADPDVFVTAWRRIYEIFREEGVDNCIWIFNPNDRNCPPSRWNDGTNYYPGNEYVQMLGVTGYNNGTYYEKWAEEWREFDLIYDEIQAQYLPRFSAFPWIITEFASSSFGGDKVAWIENMFDHLSDYPNIKAAVWFSSADYDGDIPARPYWLDETEDTLSAFRQGLKKGEKQK